MTRRHVDESGSQSLADLLIEAGLAGDLPEAKRVAVCPTGVELAAALDFCQWTEGGSAKQRRWFAPATKSHVETGRERAWRLLEDVTWAWCYDLHPPRVAHVRADGFMCAECGVPFVIGQDEDEEGE